VTRISVRWCKPSRFQHPSAICAPHWWPFRLAAINIDHCRHIYFKSRSDHRYDGDWPARFVFLTS
jgi:hypothetical protein